MMMLECLQVQYWLKPLEHWLWTTVKPCIWQYWFLQIYAAGLKLLLQHCPKTMPGTLKTERTCNVARFHPARKSRHLAISDLSI